MYRLVVFDLSGTLTDPSAVSVFGSATIFRDMRELIIKLRRSGRVISVATMMSENHAKKIVGSWDIKDLFSSVNGRISGERKEMIIRRSMESAGIPASETVMIGDTPNDMIESEKCGADFIPVPWADFISGSVKFRPDSCEDLLKYILSH